MLNELRSKKTISTLPEEENHPTCEAKGTLNQHP
jgi:hypothetical protein